MFLPNRREGGELLPKREGDGVYHQKARGREFTTLQKGGVGVDCQKGEWEFLTKKERKGD